MKNLPLFVPNQIVFSNLSYDFNPIHLEEDYLEDTQFEYNLQYGANLLLSACEYVISDQELFI